MKNPSYFLSLIKDSPKITELLFYLIIFSLPFQFRHFFPSSHSFVSNYFIEYNSFYLSFTEILIILFLSLQLKNILKQIKTKMSMSLFFILFIGFFSIILNILKATDPALALHKISHLLLWITFLYWSCQYINNREKILKIIQVSVLAASCQSIIAILQFSLQHSLSLTFLGESQLSPQTLGVAKIDWLNQKFIRAYGTEPHPNILAGYLLTNLILIFSYFVKLKKDAVHSASLLTKCSTWNILLKIPTFFQRGKKITSQKCSTWNISKNIYLTQDYKKETLLFFGLLILNIIGLCLTFSRINLFLFIVFLIYLALFHVEHFKNLKKPILISFLTLIIFFIPFFNLIQSRINEQQSPNCSTWNNCISFRKYYQKIALNIIEKKPLLGVGAGNFVLNLNKYGFQQLDPWDLQPVHNIYLLIISELGFINFILLFFSCFYLLLKKDFKTTLKLNRKMFHVEHFNKNAPELTILKMGIFLILVSGLFDHYLFSFSQGFAIWVLLFLVFLASRRLNNKMFHVEHFVIKQRYTILYKNQFE